MRAAIIMGSTSDLPKVEPAVAILKDYGVEVDVSPQGTCRPFGVHRGGE